MSVFDLNEVRDRSGSKEREAAIDKYSSFWTDENNYFQDSKRSPGISEEKSLSYFVSDINQSELHDFSNNGFEQQNEQQNFPSSYNNNFEDRILGGTVSDVSFFFFF
jgi:hypothetical protein